MSQNIPTLTPSPENLVADALKFTANWIADLTARHQPTGLIYHYCDANALLSIFRHKRLWATSTRYLNDNTEMVSMLANLPEHLDSYSETPAGRALVEMAEVMRNFGSHMIANAIGMERYASCFSEGGDILNQWRAYADNGRGFAIGFDPRHLRILGDGDQRCAELKRMTYGGSEEGDFVDSLFQGLAQLLEPHVKNLETTGWDGGQTIGEWFSLRLGECLAELTYECKHPSFQEENEWRIFANEGEISFRASAGRIVPYRELDVTMIDDANLMPIKEIVMGPLTNRQDTERVLTYIADQHGYGHSGIRFVHSQIPYR